MAEEYTTTANEEKKCVRELLAAPEPTDEEYRWAKEYLTSYHADLKSWNENGHPERGLQDYLSWHSKRNGFDLASFGSLWA